MKFQIRYNCSRMFFISWILVMSLKANAQMTVPKAVRDTLLIASEEKALYPCSKPKSPLFELPVNQVLELEIKTDFNKLYETEKSEQSRIDGILSYTHNNQKINLPIRIKARGNTRFIYCKYKPLDIKFTSSLDSTIFEGIDDKIDITTHCGDMEIDQWVLEGTDNEHINRLLGEYYMYSVLETLETITRSVSLCKIKYIDNRDGLLVEQFAFILETYEEVAERCNLERDKEDVYFIDKNSVDNVYLLNHFITNYDWKYEFSDTTGWIGHNMKFLRSKDSKLAYVLPYDFDLNALLYPDYWKNKQESFDEHCYIFEQVLKNRFADNSKLEAPYTIYKNIPKIRSMIEESYLHEEYKKRFLYWIDSYEFILENHLNQYWQYRKKLQK